MKIGEVMVRNVSVCRPNDNLAEVAGRMWDNACGALPVLDLAGNVTGMITDRDVCIALGTRNARASEICVQDVSLPRVFTCKAGEDIRQALYTMVAQGVRRLPVVDDEGKIAGILSIDDVMLRAGESSDGGGVGYREVVDAARAIVEERGASHAHPPAELMATRA